MKWVGKKLVNYKSDLAIAAVTLIFSLFLAPNYSATVGLFYLGMALAYMVVHISPHLPQVSVFKGDVKLFNYIMIAMVAGVFWIIGSQFAIMAFLGESSSVSNVLSLFASQSLVNLGDSPEFNLLTYGIHVPVTETLGFFGFVMAFVAVYLFKIPIKWQPKNWKMWFVALLIGISFALFHLSAHDPSELVKINADCVRDCDVIRISTLTIGERIELYNNALIVDAMFGMLSALTVFYYGALLPALIFHLIVNLFVLVTRFGWV